MVIAVDAAGGDYFPKNPVQGAIEAIGEKQDLTILLVGPEDLIKAELRNYSYDTDRIQILHAPDVIGMDESPSAAVKNKRNSSIVLGLSAHKQKKCEAFVSAGNTGALLAASMFILGKLEGVQRPTIAATIPTIKGIRLLIDAGANLELKPETYRQFAQMGTIYSREIMEIKDPTVGLINVGEEPEKGTELLKEVFGILKEIPNFRGNIEGRDIFNATADIFLCDGLIGNILLKFGESIPSTLQMIIGKTMKEMNLDADTRDTVVNVLHKSLHSFNYEHVGGIPFLGVDGISMVGHGGSTPAAVKNMILNASNCVEAGINEKIIASLQN
jgi:phosphate acyltransferase